MDYRKQKQYVSFVRTRLKRNEKITLTLINHDAIEHDIEISPFLYQTFNGGHNSSSSHTQHSKKDNVLHLHASSKTTNQLTFVPKIQGTYQFYCTIPGHKELGMIGHIRISN
ncbi:plastocyanin/azurin family copper-binding protein [Fictibacillus sp. NRS-1165]|uniref:plastocyanin/azurin family copper-binding protein n=1 Tax=Fictibacillus sp. NRS-1165 TaxID=3144463 RepID=UPI003D2392E8